MSMKRSILFLSLFVPGLKRLCALTIFYLGRKNPNPPSTESCKYIWILLSATVISLWLTGFEQVVHGKYFESCLYQTVVASWCAERNPNKWTKVKCGRVGRAVPRDSLGSAALNSGVCVLYCCLTKKRPVVEPCNAEHFPKCPRCHHPSSVVPSSGYLLWTLPPGHISPENSYYSYDSASK